MRSEAAATLDQAGFTLVELMVALCISALVLSGLGMALYQFNSVTRLHQDTLLLNQQIQNAATVLNRDVVGASGGTVAGDSLSLGIPTYTFGQVTDPITETITYSLESDTLKRNDGSQTMVVARYIAGADFGPPGPISTTLSITLTGTVHGETRQTVLSFNRRPSE